MEEDNRERKKRRYEHSKDFSSRRERPFCERYSEPSCSSNSDKHFEDFKRELDSVFFKPRNSPLVYKSEEYESFWKFARKYEQRKKQEGGKGETMKKASTNSLGIPVTHSRDYTINLKLKLGTTRELMGLLPPREINERISEEMLVDFQTVLSYYLDFMQKEKFNKLKKLRETQRGLPIAQYRDAIISSVTKNNVIIVAGDTGCGKSTQVPQYLLKSNFKGIGMQNGPSPQISVFYFSISCQLFQ